MSHTDRVVLLVDMDCFYCQVEEKLNPSLKGKPMAVVQYNAWAGGGIIAVNYQARDRGVTRHMRGDQAKKQCPEIELVRVPSIRGKADLTKYREAGKTVAKVLQSYTTLLERASVDEAYLDISEAVRQRLTGANKEITLGQLKNTHVVGWHTMDFLYNVYNSGLYVESNLKLAYGGVIAEEIRVSVFEQTGYTCSAGVAHNKVMAKVVCGLHKPNKQTLLPQDCVEELYRDLPVRKIRSLGGKFGEALSEDLDITVMAELKKFSMQQLTKRYDEKTALWLYNIARGINYDPVTTRLMSKSIGCCKKFPGKAALVHADSVTHWLRELALEISERLEADLEENNRRAKQMVVSFAQDVRGKEVSSSRTHPLSSYDADKITADAFEIIKKNCTKPTGGFCLKFLGISTGKFEDCKNVNEITAFFSKVASKPKQDDEGAQGGLDELVRLCEQAKETPEDEQDVSACNFSATTEELDEDSSELKFFEDDSAENVSDADSISNELCPGLKEPPKMANEKESFFLRYFENRKQQDRNSPAPRDFNTSRNLDELPDGNSDDNEQVVENENPKVGLNVNFLQDMPGTSVGDFVELNSEEICSECGRKVPQSEMVSHMDHHFVMKMVREESKIYENDRGVSGPKQTKKDVGKKATKRKSVEMVKNSTIQEFFMAQVGQSTGGDDTELCSQCNRRIQCGDFASHLDYHAAKKLHLEINPVKSCQVENLKKNANKKDRKTKQVKSKITSVVSFFKPPS